jgi:hypothetical protein
VITARDLRIPETALLLGQPLLTRAGGPTGADVCTETVRGLTAKQAEVLAMIVRCHAATGEGASISWLARRFGTTREGMRSHVVALYRKGRLRSPATPVMPCE